MTITVILLIEILIMALTGSVQSVGTQFRQVSTENLPAGMIFTPSCIWFMTEAINLEISLKSSKIEIAGQGNFHLGVFRSYHLLPANTKKVKAGDKVVVAISKKKSQCKNFEECARREFDEGVDDIILNHPDVQFLIYDIEAVPKMTEETVINT